MSEHLRKKLISKHNEKSFSDIALQLFHYHILNNSAYARFCQALHVCHDSVNRVEDIPFLPVSLFRSHCVMAVSDYDCIFESSGTFGIETSKHYVHDVSLYEESFCSAFEYFYGSLSGYTVLALLPSYLERKGSSLVYMAEKMIRMSQHELSGFYLDEFDKLHEVLQDLSRRKQKTLLLGVSFALLDFVNTFNLHFPELIVMETGGMKGRKREITRDELHEILKHGFGVSRIHSEYGMTELLTQAYSKGEGVFRCPPWMKVFVRDSLEPQRIRKDGKTGGINIIDLANMYSCPFIATDDLGKVYEDGSFEVLGRIDQSAIRGCNTMIE